MFRRRAKITLPRYEYAPVYGSRKVIKDAENPNQQHYYQTDGEDLWTHYGKKIADLIPEGMIVYAELVGFTPQGQAIQKNYTYNCAPNEAELYVYRVAHINAQGHLSDLSWDGVKEFCRSRGLKWTPELDRVSGGNLHEVLEDEILSKLDSRFADNPNAWPVGGDVPLPLSNPKTVDEGVCLRQEGLVPLILKAKSPKFLEHETNLLDKGEADIESMESVAA